MTQQSTYAWLAVGLFATAFACSPARAAPETLVLTPGNTLAQSSSHALMTTFTSTYRQLAGVLNFDWQARTCQIDIHLVVRSMTSPNALVRDKTMSKSFLDPEDFPENHYVGTCRNGQLVGTLTMHGQTHPFNMALTYAGTPDRLLAVHAEGVLNREDWGLTGLHMVVGKTIQITNDIALDGKPPHALR